MKQWLMKLFTSKILANLQRAAEQSDAWKAAATPEHARKLAEQLLRD